MKHFDFINEWRQVFGRWNWYEFDFVQVCLEKDNLDGMGEFRVIFLGLGFRIYWEWGTIDADFKQERDHAIAAVEKSNETR